MTRRKIDAHPSVVLCFSPKRVRLLMGVYDEEYSKPAYRLSANNLGGNPEPGEDSPENVLIREVSEEFDPNHALKKINLGHVSWSNPAAIRAVRNALLGNVIPFMDFYVEAGSIPGGNNPYSAVYSVFQSVIPEEVIDRVDLEIKNQRRMMGEGLFGIFTLDELANNPRGEFSTAYATAPILNYKFDTKIPFPSTLIATVIGDPRASFKDYESEFVYDSKALVRASKAQI
ncbi:hypothetical protein CO038_01165 [Candidatus Pacearchaeota archaeon CG_4_9_14_0_2_um_filter_39_13]|nr:hypothetical protein [Candidatus Pacearchaeota archaeon]OIO43206.1 MAG: hypothetical protein AUJ64_02585 [Candidatus Pacearchaeota archaeon CG1_02_39_14]PJC44903.1 MAG: hypothetical protein CO038_01165 [Candidatus Pacearchaeota archaeon CG_4_9_14_0_2_um_filter_39_13]